MSTSLGVEPLLEASMVPVSYVVACLALVIVGCVLVAAGWKSNLTKRKKLGFRLIGFGSIVLGIAALGFALVQVSR